jgi:hypothetical protein
MLDVAHALTAGATGRLRVLFGFVCLELGDYETGHRSFLTCAVAETLPQSPLEQAMVFAGVIASASLLNKHDETEPALCHLESCMRRGPMAHPLLIDLLDRALAHVVTDDHHTRLAALVRSLES